MAALPAKFDFAKANKLKVERMTRKEKIAQKQAAKDGRRQQTWEKPSREQQVPNDMRDSSAKFQRCPVGAAKMSSVESPPSLEVSKATSAGVGTDCGMSAIDAKLYRSMPGLACGTLLSTILDLPAELQVGIYKNIAPHLLMTLKKYVPQIREVMQGYKKSTQRYMLEPYECIAMLFGIRINKDVDRVLGESWREGRYMSKHDRVLSALEKLYDDAALMTEYLLDSFWPKGKTYKRKPAEDFFDSVLVLTRMLSWTFGDRSSEVSMRGLYFISRLSVERRARIMYDLQLIANEMWKADTPDCPGDLTDRRWNDIINSGRHIVLVLFPEMLNWLRKIHSMVRRRNDEDDNPLKNYQAFKVERFLAMEYNGCCRLYFPKAGLEIRIAGTHRKGTIGLHWQENVGADIQLAQQKAVMLIDTLQFGTAFSEATYTAPDRWQRTMRSRAYVHSRLRYWDLTKWRYSEKQELNLASLFHEDEYEVEPRPGQLVSKSLLLARKRRVLKVRSTIDLTYADIVSSGIRRDGFYVAPGQGR